MQDAASTSSGPVRLGKYELRREVGRGSMGTVYLGYDPFADENVAIKVAHSEAMRDGPERGRSRKLFFNEAKVAGMLKHPNIVEVRDAGVEDDTWFIVMEYIPGDRTLRDHTKPDSLLPIEDVVRAIFKCAKALDQAHRSGVVHRDIKPRNILLTPDGDIKIGDFGIALITKLEATDTQVDGYLGSPLYMSPEQIGMGNVTNQADIWSLGVVMYELLTGHHPFAANSLPSIIHQITTQPYVPINERRAGLPKILQHVVDRMLMKQPDRRYKTCLDVAGDLSLVFDQLNLSEEELSGREKFNRIKGLAFFRDFTVSEIWEVINANIWMDFTVDQAIITEGEMDNSFYIIVNGEVEVRRGASVMDGLKPGDCFGEMGFISTQKRTASIIARTDVSVMKVRASLIERTSLSCQLRFHKVFLNTLVERLSAANLRISESTQTEAPDVMQA
ncbi:MAG: serine/threonine-protein kinase [Pseudomonadota bacterium]